MALSTQGSLCLSITTAVPKTESKLLRSAGTFAFDHHRLVSFWVDATLLQGQRRSKSARTFVEAEAGCKAASVFTDGGAAGWWFNRQLLVSHCVLGHRVHPLLRPSRLPRASLWPAASATRSTENATSAATGLSPPPAQPTVGDHHNGRATGQLERAPENGGAPRKLGAGEVSGEASEAIGSSLAQEADVVGAWRAEIFGASKPAAVARDERAGGAPSWEKRSNLGGVTFAAGGTNRGSSWTRTKSGSGGREGMGTADEMGAGRAEGEEEALRRKTALAATLLGLDEQPADVSGASGPPAREVLAGLKNPPWKAISGGGGVKQETEVEEGPVLNEGDRWRQERLQLHLANKARVNASRAAESSGRGGGKAREDMARVRKSRGLEGLGAERKHSRLGDVTVARAAMFMQFNKEVHEAIKEAVGRGGLGEGLEVEGALPQGEAPDRVPVTGGEKAAGEAAATGGGLSASERGEEMSELERGPFEEEPAAVAPSLLKSALAATSVPELRQVLADHEAAVSDVLDAEDGSMLVRELSWAGRVDLASAVFRTLCESGNEPSARACHALIVAAHQNDDYRTALRVFSMARVREIVPNRVTCMAAIEACHRLGRWREAKAIFSDMGRCGLEPDTLAYNALLMTLGAARETREVEAVWERMKGAGVRPNQQTYGLLISTLTKADKVDDALEIYERLTKDGFQASAIMYEGLVVLLCRSKRDRMALNFYHEMRLSGHVLSPRGHSVLLSALAKGWVLDWESALEVYTNMKLDQVPLEVHHLTSLLKVLALSRQTDTALGIWKEALAAGVEPDLSCYNSVIGVLRVVCDYDRAMDFFWAMKDRGIPPDQETYGNLLWACSEPGLFKSALKLYEDMKHSGVAPNTHAFTALFTVMGRAGEWQTALELWKEMRSLGIKPSTKTYNAMMGCLGRCRKPDLMLKAHKQMLDEGIKPDDTTRHFLGKFGPPGTSQSSQAWGSGNLMGQRVELKHYGRGGEAPGDPGPVYNPREKYRKEGVLLAMKREDSGWVRRDRERQLMEERRRAQVRGKGRDEGMREGEESGLRKPVKVVQPGEGRGEEDEHEPESVSEDEEGLEEGNGTGKGDGGRPVEASGQRTRAPKQAESLGKAPLNVQEPRKAGEERMTMNVEDGVNGGAEKDANIKKKGRKGKGASDENDVPLWQII